MRCIPKFDFCHNCKVCHRSKGQVLWLLELGTAFACSPNVSYWVHTCHHSAASLSSQSASRRQKESHVAKDKVSSSLLLVFQDCSKGSMQCIHWTTGNSSTFFFSYPLPIFFPIGLLLTTARFLCTFDQIFHTSGSSYLCIFHELIGSSSRDSLGQKQIGNIVSKPLLVRFPKGRQIYLSLVKHGLSWKNMST